MRTPHARPNYRPAVEGIELELYVLSYVWVPYMRSTCLRLMLLELVLLVSAAIVWWFIKGRDL